MELRDLIVTPIIIVLVYIGAYYIRPLVTDSVIRKYFMPALTVRIIGAIVVGFLYQFYYDGGDTFNFHTHGSRHIWEAFLDSPMKGFNLLLADGQYESSTYQYASQIWYFRDQQSYFVITIVALFDLLTFSTYSATAVLFALVGFSGSWVMFKTFYKLYPNSHSWISLACLFVPTVCFWGSGIFKDTLTLAALGWITYSIYESLFERKHAVRNIVIILFSFWIIYSIKKYILLSFLPALILWLFSSNAYRIRSQAGRVIIFPIVIVLVAFLTYFSIDRVTIDDPRYKISNLAATAKITAYDIRFGWGARTGEGSGYNLGELDGTWTSLIKLAPQAINVALFRPYLWEVKNPLMLLSAIENFILLLLTLNILIRIRSRLFKFILRPEVLFCLSFALIFSFAVGVSSYNFGTLSRYKIPMMPFYSLVLVMLYSIRKENLIDHASGH